MKNESIDNPVPRPATQAKKAEEGSPVNEQVSKEGARGTGEKWTPGPWHVMVGAFGKMPDLRSATVYATHEDLVYVARCDGSQLMIHDKLDAVANAFLIAAAPDLYEALADLVSYYSPDSDEDNPLWLAARAAINLSRGRVRDGIEVKTSIPIQSRVLPEAPASGSQGYSVLGVGGEGGSR
jgi:hypothetical protein